MLRTLLFLTVLAGALTDSALTKAPDADCALRSETKGIPAAIEGAITGARGQGSSLHEGPPNIRSAHAVRVTREGRSANLCTPDLARLDRPRQSPWPLHAGRNSS